jgi:hypothetical protein
VTRRKRGKAQTDDAKIGRVGVNGVYNGEGEFALGQVFAEALVVCVLFSIREGSVMPPLG